VYTEVGGEKKPSQLFAKMIADGFSEQQALKTWLQVRTPEFKNRFGDRTSADKSQVSKIVDENGEPLVVYHGSRTEIQDGIFKLPKDLEQTKTPMEGISTTSSKQVAIDYANKYHHNFEGGIIYPLFVNVKNSVSLDHVGDYNSYMKYLRKAEGLSEKYNIKSYEELKEFEHHMTSNTNEYLSQDEVNYKGNIFTKEEFIELWSRGFDLLLFVSTNRDNSSGLKNPIDGITFNPHIDGNFSAATSVPYDQQLIFDPKNIKSAIDNDGSFSPETAKFNDYFGKESRFGFDSKQARDHSTFMDQFAGQATPEQIDQIRQQIDAVAQMYADKTGKQLELTDTQIQAIIDAHLLPGQLGSLTQAELSAKTRKLAEAIPDVNLRRFLLEAGFCGERKKTSNKKDGDKNNTINIDDIEIIDDGDDDHTILGDMLHNQTLQEEQEKNNNEKVAEWEKLGMKYPNWLLEHDEVFVQKVIWLHTIGIHISEFSSKFSKDFIDNLNDTQIEYYKSVIKKINNIKPLLSQDSKTYIYHLENLENIYNWLLRYPDTGLSLGDINKLSKLHKEYGDIIDSLYEKDLLPIITRKEINGTDREIDPRLDIYIERIIKGFNGSKATTEEFFLYCQKQIHEIGIEKLYKHNIDMFDLYSLFKKGDSKLTDDFFVFVAQSPEYIKKTITLRKFIQNKENLINNIDFFKQIEDFIPNNEIKNINNIISLKNTYGEENTKEIIKAFSIYYKHAVYPQRTIEYFQETYKDYFSDKEKINIIIDVINKFDLYNNRRDQNKVEKQQLEDELERLKKDNYKPFYGLNINSFINLSFAGIDITDLIQQLQKRAIQDGYKIINEIGNKRNIKSIQNIVNYLQERQQYTKEDISRIIEIGDIAGDNDIAHTQEKVSYIEQYIPEIRGLITKYPNLLELVNQDNDTKTIKYNILEYLFLHKEMDTLSEDMIKILDVNNIAIEDIIQLIDKKLQQKNDSNGIANTMVFCVSFIIKTRNIEILKNTLGVDVADHIINFVNLHQTGNKGESITNLISLLITKYNPSITLKELGSMLYNEITEINKTLEKNTIKPISELGVSMGIEYEAVQSLSNWYSSIHNSDYSSDALYTCLLANIGTDNDRDQGASHVFEYALKPTDNPHLILLETHLLNELGLLNFSKDFLNNDSIYSHNEGTGIHITLGGETGIKKSEKSQGFHNFVQNSLLSTQWAGINIARDDIIDTHGGKSSISYRGEKSDQRKGSNVVDVFNNGNTNTAEFRLYSIDGTESFERTILSKYFLGIGLQAIDKYTSITSENIKSLFNQDINSENVLEILNKNNLIIENIPSKEVENVIIEFINLQKNIFLSIEHHNKNFINNIDNIKSNFISLVSQGKIVGFTKEDISTESKALESIKKYINHDLQINYEELYKNNTNQHNIIRKINQLFLKDGVNEKAFFSNTKNNITNEMENSNINRHSRSIFNSNPEDYRDGYYYIQNGSPDLIIHDMQKHFIKYNNSIKNLLK
ncbi:MAG TPA: hypothetical protein PK048_03605, partial [Candidatus Absconditabacterales bacterium]|nr:hypothetical protein [Candidatus Absconditabacterales bacterium]